MCMSTSAMLFRRPHHTDISIPDDTSPAHDIRCKTSLSLSLSIHIPTGPKCDAICKICGLLMV